MKKLILSAIFALACFTANAKNEIIKNEVINKNGDKNPKNKAKVVAKAETKDTPALLPGQFCSTVQGSANCGEDITVFFESTVCASNPTRAFLLAWGTVQGGINGVRCN